MVVSSQHKRAALLLGQKPSQFPIVNNLLRPDKLYIAVAFQISVSLSITWDLMDSLALEMQATSLNIQHLT